ncbi:hypothetical protein TNIN_357921 [Trichonephila inaurata madagascariensis]|uniref:Uncharacterized protein n=1 Tax=Trichonephila inaurata madagascariensis TaxID=2747483 RepID=A0A8X6IUD5_9ARAC|nr:hypothetical protein TNIN_357921 [Trichonephila inaurata madagascariensis]
MVGENTNSGIPVNSGSRRFPKTRNTDFVIRRQHDLLFIFFLRLCQGGASKRIGNLEILKEVVAAEVCPSVRVERPSVHTNKGPTLFGRPPRGPRPPLILCHGLYSSAAG